MMRFSKHIMTGESENYVKAVGRLRHTHQEKCIGCGVCAVTCPEEALKLRRFERSESTYQTAMDLMMTVAGDNNRL